MIIVHEEFTFGASLSATVANPERGDLILFTVHQQSGAVSSITYGGVTPTLIVAAASDWPQTYIYGIWKDDQPAVGQSHLLEVNTTSAANGLTITKIAGIDLASALDFSSLVTAVEDTSTISAGMALSISAPANSLIFGTITHRDGAPASLESSGVLLSSAPFAAPRGYGAAYRILDTAGDYEFAWSWSPSNRRRACLVAIPLITGKISGTVKDHNGAPCQRPVYAMSRPSDGTAPYLLGSTLSDPATGEYSLAILTKDEVSRIILATDEPLLNDIVDRVIPA